jgi:hypothetical protein
MLVMNTLLKIISKLHSVKQSTTFQTVSHFVSDKQEC